LNINEQHGKHSILLTGGRAPVTLDLARKLKQAGAKVYVAESLSAHLCQYSNAVTKTFRVPSPAKSTKAFIAALIHIIMTYKIDLLIPTCEEVFYISMALKELQSITAVFTDNIHLMQKLHHKLLFNRLIKDTGISVPESFLITSEAEYHSLIAQGILRYPHVLKPAYSRFATEIQFMFAANKRVSEFSPEKPWIAQAYKEGRLICSYSLCSKGKLLANVVYENQYTTPNHGAGIQFTVIQHQKLVNWLISFIQNIHYTGQLGIDIIEDSDGNLWPIECNPRATSGLHFIKNSQSLLNAFLEKQILPEDSLHNQPLMLALPMLIYGSASTHSMKTLWVWLRSFWQSKDVIFKWRDPLPGICQMMLAWHLYRLSRQHQISINQVSTYDIEWNGL
jgi:predicted ATP-grasp superfamily ATP-dependent carboligase